MIHFSSALLSLVLFSVLMCLASGRLMVLVKIMAFQGIAVSLVPLFCEYHGTIPIGSLLFLQFMIIVKGFLIPAFLLVAVKKIKVQREDKPIVGYHASVFAGLIFILVSAFMADNMRIYLPGKHILLMATAITTLISGLFLLMTRAKAINQVIGYLMMENGIYLIGTALAKQTHTLYVVEFGVLLDLLVCIMIMGIVLHNINRAYDDVDTGLLGQLKD